MKEYQQRVIEEKEQLDAKLQRLNTFLQSPVFLAVEGGERARLHKQQVVMQEYLDVLTDRIKNFDTETTTETKIDDEKS